MSNDYISFLATDYEEDELRPTLRMQVTNNISATNWALKVQDRSGKGPWTLSQSNNFDELQGRPQRFRYPTVSMAL